MKLFITYFLTFMGFLAIDLLWLGVIAAPLYSKILGGLLAQNPNWTVALVFYLLYIVGIFYFAILPAAKINSVGLAIKNGALFGFFNYMTYDFTNWAVIENWPGHLTWIDLPWGVFITCATALLGYVLHKKICT